MSKKLYTYTIVYIVAMIIIPFLGIPFDFRRFIVLIGSVVFLAYFWHSYRKGTQRPTEVIIEETTFTTMPTAEAASTFENNNAL